MKRVTFCVGALLAVALAVTVWASEGGAGPQVRLEVDLVDGSRIIGTPAIESVPVETSYAKMDVALKQIQTLRIGEDHETASLELRNGDKLKGVVDLGALKLDTAFGKVKVASEHIKGLRVVSCGGELPAGEGTLSFGGVNWMPWRTQFEVQGDKLVSLPKARPGFNYGHSGNGRGPVLVTNIGSTGWKDYSIECQFCMSGVNPAFNPYGLPLDYRNGSILFHVVNAKESFNERGVSCYVLNVEQSGDWSLRSTYNEYCAVPCGYGNPTSDGGRMLAKGDGLKLDATNGNKFRIDVSGERIQIWVDGESLVDVQDEKMGEPVNDQTLDHGGVGFVWGMDSMGWIRDFSARPR
jgi:hypothetical protein